MIADYEFLNQITNNSNEEEHMKMSDSRLSSDNLDNRKSFVFNRKAQSILKKSFQAEIKAQNIYLAVQEINENEFMSQIQKDINEKKNRYKHLKHDFKKLHKKSHTLSKHLQLEILNNSPKTYKNLKKINQTQFLSSNETTQLLNNLSIVSSALNLNSSLTQNKFIAKSQILKRAPNLNEDSIFSILGLQTKNQASFSKRKSKASIFIDPNNHGEVEFQNSAKKEINSIPMSWKLAKIDYLSKNLKFTSCKMNENEEQNKESKNLANPSQQVSFFRNKNMNKIEKFRKIFLIFGNFSKFSPLKVTEILLPVYKQIFDKQSLRADLTEWFDKAKSLLGINSELNHLFLINALSIDYLCEVPLECNVLMVDIFGKCNFWVNVLKFHKMTSISKGKVNFIMNFLNTRKEVREIIVFLNDHTKFSTIRNEVESVFEKFQGDDGLSSLKKASFETSKRLKNQILDSLDYMENHYFTTMDVDGHHGADREMLIEAHYKKIMDQTLADIYRKINEVSNEDFSKLHPNDLEMRYNVDEDKLTPEEKGIIGEKLNFLLKSYEKNFNKKIRRDNLKNVEIDLKNSAIDKEKINFILENKEKMSNKWDKNLENLERRYPALFQLDIPKIESEYIFTRFELHNFYTKFKSLVHMNATDLKNKKYDVDKGIDINTFRKGLTENFASAHEELIRKMFSLNNHSSTMKWSQYLNILNSVRAKTLQSKLDLFFKLMDSDENGKLSYSEIKFLCFHSLKKLLKSSEDFVEDLSGNFAKFVFNALGLNMSEEIKTKTLKNFMVNNSQSREVDLLLMMCCAEKNQDEKFLDDNIHMDNSVYTNKATENNLKAKGEFFKKEELLLKKQLKFDPDNKKLQKRSSVIQIAKILNFQQEKDIYNDEIIKKKQEEKNLMEKLKQKAEERKINLIKFGGNESDILE